MFAIQSAKKSAFSGREWRDLLADVLERLILFRARGESIKFACPLLQLGVKYVTISLEDVKQLRLKFGKYVDPFNICRQEQGTGRRAAKLRLGV